MNVTFLLFFTFLVPHFIFGQNIKPIKLVYPENTYNYPLGIEFLDTITGERINYFDLIEQNPYNHLKYPVTDRYVGNGNLDYDLKQQTLKDIVDDATLYNQNELNRHFESGASYTFISDPGFRKSAKGENFVVVIYQFAIDLHIEGFFGFYKSTIIVLDCTGKKFFEIIDLEQATLDPSISSNGEFLVFSYADNPYKKNKAKPGISIYHVPSNQLMYNVTSSNDEMPGIGHYKGLFYAIQTVSMDEDEFMVIDPWNNIAYTKRFPRKFTFHGFTKIKDGVLVRLPGESDYSELLLSEFEVKKLKTMPNK